MLKKEQIFEGQTILSDYTQDRKTIGIIKDVQNAIDAGKRSRSDKTELTYKIFYPTTGKTTDYICEHSGVTSEAEVLEEKQVELLLLSKINENSNKIISLRGENFRIAKTFEFIFKKAPVF